MSRSTFSTARTSPNVRLTPRKRMAEIDMDPQRRQRDSGSRALSGERPGRGTIVPRPGFPGPRLSAAHDGDEVRDPLVVGDALHPPIAAVDAGRLPEGGPVEVADAVRLAPGLAQ